MPSKLFDKDTFLIRREKKHSADILTFQKVDSGVENWHGLMEAQQGPAVNNLNNPIEPAVQQVNIKVTKPDSPDQSGKSKSRLKSEKIPKVHDTNLTTNITLYSNQTRPNNKLFKEKA